MSSSSSIPQRSLGGDASHIKIGQVGLGLMGLTWTSPENFTPDEQAFDVMKTAVDSGVTLFDSGAFYGPQSDPYANIKLVKRFFDAEPAYASKVTLCIKGGMNIAGYQNDGPVGLRPDGSVEHLRQNLKAIREALGSDDGGHEVDIFEPARKQPDLEIEDLIANLEVIKKEGLFKHIGLSEVAGETIRRAAKAGPIALVEVEYSTVETTVETNGVLAACEELQIPILAYSPLGKGWLGGAITGAKDVPAGDVRSHVDSFKEENAAKNVELANKYKELASSRSPPITAAQLALAWLIHQSPTGIVVPIPGSSKPERVKSNAAAADVKMDKQELEELRKFVDSNKLAGERYNAAIRQHGNLWS